MLSSYSQCLRFPNVPSVFDLRALIPIRCPFSQEAILDSLNTDSAPALCSLKAWFLPQQKMDPIHYDACLLVYRPP